MAKSSIVTFSCTDDKSARAYLIQNSLPTINWIFIFHDFFGLSERVKKYASDIFENLGNVHVLAFDLYDGELPASRDEASRLMNEFNPVRGHAMIDGAIKHVGHGARFATIGWSFGGKLSMEATIRAGKQAIGCVIYFGKPEDDVEQLRLLQCDVLVIWPVLDKWINRPLIEAFETAMSTAGKKLIIKSFEADHAFTFQQSLNYLEPEARAAENEVVNYLIKKFGM